MKKKNQKKKKKRKNERFISAILHPLAQGASDTIELALICLIIAVFRLIFTGNSILYKPYVVEAVLLIYSLVSVLGAELYIAKKETLYDWFFVVANKIIRAILYITSIVIFVFA